MGRAMQDFSAILFVVVSICLIAGCMNIGHNEQFRIGYTQPTVEQRLALDPVEERLYGKSEIGGGVAELRAGTSAILECSFPAMATRAQDSGAFPSSKENLSAAGKKMADSKALLAEIDETKDTESTGDIAGAESQKGRIAVSASRRKEILKRCVYLPRYTVKNRYDDLDNKYVPLKNGEPIRAGDHVNLIINRVFVGDNHDPKYFLGTGEVGVVVSVSDGSGTELDPDGRDVLVAYEVGIDDEVPLPIGDLLAYSNTEYGNQAIRVTVTIFEFDHQENEMLSGILRTAASAGAAAAPAYAASIGMAAEIGSLLLKSNSDDVIAKMTFQVYPWEDGPPRGDDGVKGTPRIATGSYLIVNANDDDERDELEQLKRERRIFLDDDLKPVVIDRARSVFGNVQIARAKAAPHARWASTNPLSMSHVVVTIDKSPVNDGAALLRTVDTLNRSAAGIAAKGTVSSSAAESVLAELRVLQSTVGLYQIIGAQREAKASAISMLGLMEGQEIARLAEPEKEKLKHVVLGRLPTWLAADDRCFLDPFSDACVVAMSQQAAFLRYDPNSDRYVPVDGYVERGGVVVPALTSTN